MDFKKILKYTDGLNVLYVEDDINLLEETKDILEDYFASLTTAVDGQDALVKYINYYKENGTYFDLVITDINMPNMSGDVLIKNINNINPEQSIIVVSAYNEANKLIDLIQQGIDNFLLKPISSAQFIKTLYKTSKSIFAQKKMKYYNEALTNVNQNLDEKVKNLTSEMLAIKRVSIETIINLIESYDDDTGSHVKRIEAYSKLLLENIPNVKNRYSKDLIDSIPFASLLHDTGKFLIPKEVLNKPAKLDEDEFKIMKTHAEIGGELLTKANNDFRKDFNKDSYLKVASDIAYYHHEKWNGNGYPKGLKESEIPISARIVAIVDVYDALRSKRVYKQPFSHERSLNIIQSESGISFDPELVGIFVKHEKMFNNIFTLSQG